MTRARFAPPILTALVVADCVEQGEYPDEDRNRTREGAVIGGAVGAMIGVISEDEDHLENAAIGAAIGVGAGALIGSQLDRQAAELRRSIGDERIGIVNTGSELIVTVPQDILFAADSADVQPPLQRDLRVLAANVQDYPDTSADVIGHTDNTGSARYNQDLSSRRANAVATMLTDAGIEHYRVRAYGRGGNEPLASNPTADGRARNRRVEVVIRPKAEA